MPTGQHSRACGITYAVMLSMNSDGSLGLLRYLVPVIAVIGLVTSVAVGCGVEQSDDVGIEGSNLSDRGYGYDSYGAYEPYGSR